MSSACGSISRPHSSRPACRRSTSQLARRTTSPRPEQSSLEPVCQRSQLTPTPTLFSPRFSRSFSTWWDINQLFISFYVFFFVLMFSLFPSFLVFVFIFTVIYLFLIFFDLIFCFYLFIICFFSRNPINVSIFYSDTVFLWKPFHLMLSPVTLRDRGYCIY